MIGAKAWTSYLKQEHATDNFVVGAIIGALAGAVSASTNFTIKIVAMRLTTLEGQDTRTEHERSLFKKLSAAYVMNSCFIPFILGIFMSLAAG